MAAETESYIKSAAEKRLELIKAQLVSQSVEDSLIGRQLKNAQRKDLAAQIQPLVAQVKLTKGATAKGGTMGPVGRMGMTRGGKTVSMGGNYMLGSKARTWEGGTLRGTTGSTTVLDPGARWTTSGYVDNAQQPREQENTRWRRGSASLIGGLGPSKSRSDMHGTAFTGGMNQSSNMGDRFRQRKTQEQILKEQEEKRNRKPAAGTGPITLDSLASLIGR